MFVLLHHNKPLSHGTILAWCGLFKCELHSVTTLVLKIMLSIDWYWQGSLDNHCQLTATVTAATDSATTTTTKYIKAPHSGPATAPPSRSLPLFNSYDPPLWVSQTSNKCAAAVTMGHMNFYQMSCCHHHTPDRLAAAMWVTQSDRPTPTLQLLISSYQTTTILAQTSSYW